MSQSDQLARFAEDISNAADTTGYWRGIYIGVAGDIKVDMAGSGTVTFTCVAGQWLPIEVVKVYNTGTDADNIIGVNW